MNIIEKNLVDSKKILFPLLN